MLNPQRTIDELKELRALTGDDNGAQRVAFTPMWEKSRKFLREKLKGIPVEIHDDAAGNTWATLAGKSDRALLMGGHIDSVPNGGWLDGCLNVMAGVEVLRRIASEGTPPITIRLVNWADEEGARFGRSLFGSSAFSGAIDPAELRGLRDAEGRGIADVLADNGIELRRALDASSGQGRISAYLELHIEQGPVLEADGIAAAAVNGCAGVERHRFVFRGQASHAGTTPMDRRHDAGLAAARTALQIE